MANFRTQNARAILNNFRQFYWETHDTDYKVNYAMIVMAEKISEFYSLAEINEAMEYYFKYHEGNFFEFLNDIDRFYKDSQKTEDDKARYENLEDETKAQIRKIRGLGIGEE